MRTYLRTLIAIAIGILFVLFLYGAIQASRRASEKSLQDRAEDVFRLEQKWIEDQKERLLSGQTTHVFFYSTSKSDFLVSQLAGMNEIKRLTFESTDLSDIGVNIVAKLPHLEKLTVHGGSASDVGLASLSQNSTLTELHLVNLSVTHLGVVNLQSMKNLESLTLYSNRRLKTRLDSEAIHELMKLGQLRKLNVGGGWLTSSNIAELKAALTNCEVVDNYADDEW